MVDLNNAEFRTNTLLAFTGRPYEPATPAGSGASASSSSKDKNGARAPPKDGATRVSPRPGSFDAVTLSTGDGIPPETKKTATPTLSTITEEESKDGNDGDEKASSSESSDSDSDDDASGSNDKTRKGQSPQAPVRATRTPPAATAPWRWTR